jgi:hypothetical protein
MQAQQTQGHENPTGAGPKLVNRLGASKSPYVSDILSSTLFTLVLTHAIKVRAHGHNPVAWQLWDAESMELARRHNRLIFLSIGYSACHCTSPPFCRNHDQI